MEPWNALALVAALVAAMLLVWRRMRGRSGRAAGDALGPFLRHFDALGVPTDLSLAIFHHLQRWMSDARRGFPVRAGDDLVTYGITADDVDDTLAILLAECGRHPAPGAQGTITTVEDLVRHVAACPPGGAGT